MTKLASFPNNPRRLVLFGLAAGAAQMAGCGGGGGDLAGLGSGGTGSFTTGVITSLGSIIVNGVRYDDSGITPERADDDSTLRSLIPGMVVSVEGTERTEPTVLGQLPASRASRITYGSEWKGPVDGISRTTTTDPITAEARTTGTFTILGQTVKVTEATKFIHSDDNPGTTTRSFVDLQPSPAQYVEVYGFVDPATDQLQATLIEIKNSRPDTYRLSGKLSEFSSSVTGGTARLATGPRISWASTDVVESGITAGAFVKVRLNPDPVGAVYAATRIRKPSVQTPKGVDYKQYKTEIEGLVTEFSSPSSFSVNGLPVIVPAGIPSEGTLRAGAIVEVYGTIKDGTVVATKIEVKSGFDRNTPFFGSVISVDLDRRKFILRPVGISTPSQDQTFTYTAETEFEDRLRPENLTNVASPNKVKVKAARSDSGYRALKIELEKD
jgi:hypothetical protein